MVHFSGVSWSEAELACNAHKGNLVSYANVGELDWVLSWFNDTAPIWIGLRDNGNGISYRTDFKLYLKNPLVPVCSTVQ